MFLKLSNGKKLELVNTCRRNLNVAGVQMSINADEWAVPGGGKATHGQVLDWANTNGATVSE
ncbi:MAG: hypothetical protein WCL29_05975 [Pseudomonadota bacterium]